MDKYEFNIKVEQIKKLVNKGDYETAMKIADTIDWRRVRSTSLLTMVAQVYERNEEYQDAKDILLLAFERAPIGKGLLFKLTDLALREGNVSEAEAYYREFCELSGDDPRQNLLRYLILESKDAPMEQRINSLEMYSQEELDEKWLYKLAELYHEVGNEDACVAMCDKIMLMFGLGKYVDKAMELKIQYAPLTEYQMDLVENREKYEEKLREVEERFTGGEKPDQEDDFDEEDDSYGTSERQDTYVGRNWEQDSAELQTAMATEDTVGIEDVRSQGYMPDLAEDSLEESFAVKMQEEEAERELAKEVSMLESGEVEESTMGSTRILQDIRDIKPPYSTDHSNGPILPEVDYDEEVSATTDCEEEEDTIVEDWDLEPEEEVKNHLMIEADSPERGLSLALESLKKIHKELGSKNPVAKISGENLNKKGIFAVSDRLAGKDLVVEHAADLNAVTVTELSELMEQDDTGMIVVLIDTPVRMERLHNSNPGLAGKFQYIGCDRMTDSHHKSDAEGGCEEERNQLLERRAEEQYEPYTEAEQDFGKEQYKPEEEYEPEERYQPNVGSQRAERYQSDEGSQHAERYQSDEGSQRADRYQPDEEYQEDDQCETDEGYEQDAEYQHDAQDADIEREPDDGREMDVEEFAQYACKYAQEIDCSISGKSMLALYERAEMMEEDGVPLTKTSAEELLEEAADKAEKPSFFSMFSSKYDKDGLLILKEKHFFD